MRRIWFTTNRKREAPGGRRVSEERKNKLRGNRVNAKARPEPEADTVERKDSPPSLCGWREDKRTSIAWQGHPCHLSSPFFLCASLFLFVASVVFGGSCGLVWPAPPRTDRAGGVDLFPLFFLFPSLFSLLLCRIVSQNGKTG